MRIVTYGAACSLDGFIADADGGVEWLHMSRDAQAIMAEYWATIDTLVWGRKTWDMAAAMGGGGDAGPGRCATTCAHARCSRSEARSSCRTTLERSC